jgi:hypothetical protein
MVFTHGNYYRRRVIVGDGLIGSGNGYCVGVHSYTASDDVVRS